METRGDTKLSRAFLLSLTALGIWGAASASVLQFSTGGLFWGVLFTAAAVVLLAIAVEGNLLRRLEGKPTSRANLLVFVGVLVLVGANELWGLFIGSANAGARFLMQLVFTVGFLVLLAVTARNALRLPRSG